MISIILMSKKILRVHSVICVNKFLKTKPFEFLDNKNNLFAIKMLLRMKLAFSHLQHKFRHGFNNTLNPHYSWSIKAETITHYFLCWHFYTSNLANLMNDLKILPLFLLQLVITILLLFLYMVMISSMTQRIKNANANYQIH